MIIDCPVCRSHVPLEVAVELVFEGTLHRFCSARCADTVVSGGEAFAPLAPLPSLPRKLLVAVDGSGPSLRAVATAATLARASHGEIRLLCAVDSGWTGALRMLATGARQPDMSATVERALREDADAQLDHCRRLCEHAGVPVTTRVVFQPPFEAIVDAAKDADLVVMGSRGRHGLGNLSPRVLAGTHTPILIVH